MSAGTRVDYDALYQCERQNHEDTKARKKLNPPSIVKENVILRLLATEETQREHGNTIRVLNFGGQP